MLYSKDVLCFSGLKPWLCASGVYFCMHTYTVGIRYTDGMKISISLPNRVIETGTVYHTDYVG